MFVVPNNIEIEGDKNRANAKSNYKKEVTNYNTQPISTCSFYHRIITILLVVLIFLMLIFLMLIVVLLLKQTELNTKLTELGYLLNFK